MRALSAVLRSLLALPSGWLRRTALTLVLGVVAFSVVGMHQLSLSHFFATPPGVHESAAAAKGSMASQHDTLSMGPGAPVGHPVEVSRTAPAGSPGGHDGCLGCGDHSTAFGACLLALTLLVLFWWLAPPRVRHLHRRALRRPAAVISVLTRRVPALSLSQLAILRI